jgi:hypothetical protein
MAWTTPEFVNKFLARKLGRKKVHGSFRVIEGAHCRVLTHVTSRYGNPDDVEVYAIELINAVDENLVFLHPSNYYGHSYKIKREIRIDDYQKLPGILSNSDEGLLNSGIVQINEDFCLLEIGDKPYLLKRRYLEGGAPASMPGGLPKWDTVEPISQRVATIEKARVLTQDPEGCESIADEWWGRHVPAMDVPDFDPELSKVIVAGVNPADYGYEVEELMVESVFDGFRFVSPRGQILNNKADKRGVAYLAAVERFKEACEKHQKYQPQAYDGLSTKKDRHSYGSTDRECTGKIVCTTLGVFVTGHIKSSEHWNVDLDCGALWYKLEKRIERKRLAS